MITEELHTHFDDNEVRTFLAKHLKSAPPAAFNKKVKQIEKEIKKLQLELEYTKVVEGIYIMLKQRHWKNYNISNLVDYTDDKYIDFIGNSEEYNKALDILVQK